LPPSATPSSQQPPPVTASAPRSTGRTSLPGQRPHRRTDPQRHRNPRRHHERASYPACRRPWQRTHAPSDSDPAHRSTHRMTGSHPAIHAVAGRDCAPLSRRPLPEKLWKGSPPGSPKPGSARVRGKKVRRGTNDHPVCCRNPERRQNIRLTCAATVRTGVRPACTGLDVLRRSCCHLVVSAGETAVLPWTYDAWATCRPRCRRTAQCWPGR
jgi:hypothetical protein